MLSRVKKSTKCFEEIQNKIKSAWQVKASVIRYISLTQTKRVGKTTAKPSKIQGFGSCMNIDNWTVKQPWKF